MVVIHQNRDTEASSGYLGKPFIIIYYCTLLRVKRYTEMVFFSALVSLSSRKWILVPGIACGSTIELSLWDLLQAWLTC